MDEKNNALTGSFINFICTFGKYPDPYTNSNNLKEFRLLPPFHLSLDKVFNEDTKVYFDSLFEDSKIYATKINVIVLESVLTKELSVIVFNPNDGYFDRVIPIKEKMIIKTNGKEIIVNLLPVTTTLQ